MGTDRQVNKPEETKEEIKEKIKTETKKSADDTAEDPAKEDAAKPSGRIEQGYFSYPDVGQAEDAVTERDKIRRLEKQLDLRRPQLVYTLYVKALEGRVFHTAEGYAWLLHIREYLEKNRQNIQGDIPGLPSDFLQDDAELLDARAKLKELREGMRRMRTDLKRSRMGRSISHVVIAFLLVAVIAMLVIAGVSDNPNILNYERVLQDRYAGWEQELKEREALIREKERGLDRGTAEEESGMETSVP